VLGKLIADVVMYGALVMNGTASKFGALPLDSPIGPILEALPGIRT
jgi:hypothetical protein